MANGFTKIKGRNAWGWHGDCIWVFNISSLPKVFSLTSKWPAYSLTVRIGIYYTFLPPFGQVKVDENDLLYPREYECNRRAELTCSYDQLKYTKCKISIDIDRDRNDIWWIESDGSNIDEVINDINSQFLRYAVKWFNEKSNKELTLQEADRLNGIDFDEIEI